MLSHPKESIQNMMGIQESESHTYSEISSILIRQRLYLQSFTLPSSCKTDPIQRPQQATQSQSSQNTRPRSIRRRDLPRGQFG